MSGSDVGARAIAAPAEFSSYYGKPIVKEPTWAALDIAGYLFLGGLAGASSTLAAGAQLTGRPGLARPLKLGAAGAISLSLLALIRDLGRPERFLNMLRVFKPTSPMSVGVWIITAYAPAAVAAAAGDLIEGLRPLGRAGTVGAAMLGPAVASYTGVLIADTATPAWHEGHREMPFVFVGSGASAAAGLGLLFAPLAQNSPAVRLAVIGASAEMAAVKILERRIGIVAENYHQGRAGKLMRAAEALTVLGVLGAVRYGRRRRAAAAVSGAALLAASACARFGIFEAGRQSARDPRYTVVPQRERAQREGALMAAGYRRSPPPERPGPSGLTGLRPVLRDGERDLVAIEEPLEIRVDGEPVAVTMRTPGHDEELAAGFLFGEGLIEEAPSVGLAEDLAANTIEVLGPLSRRPASRRFYTTSSCGVCGKGALEEVAVQSAPLPAGPRIERRLLAGLPDRLVQPGFLRSGGLHATGLFNAGGELICAREDVGRHNAMDKVVGWALLSGNLPLHSDVLCVSGRLSFELVQKAAVAGAAILVGVGAPTSLAVDLAADRGMTLCGFARKGRMNVYTGPERVLASRA